MPSIWIDFRKWRETAKVVSYRAPAPAPGLKPFVLIIRKGHDPEMDNLPRRIQYQAQLPDIDELLN